MTTATAIDHFQKKETIRELLQLSIRLNPTADHRRNVLCAFGALVDIKEVMTLNGALDEVFDEERIA